MATAATIPDPTFAIGCLQQLWEAAIQRRHCGVGDTDAMRTIYQSINPQLTFREIADVFSAVYADTYWRGTHMDYSILSKSMAAALDIEKDLANQYAYMAMMQWRGLLCRRSFDERDTLSAIGVHADSPDIINSANASLDPQHLIDRWHSEFWQPPVAGKNHIYVRCQNVGFGGPLASQVRVYATHGGFNQPPSSWQQLATEAGNTGTGSIWNQRRRLGGKMIQGERGVSEAFAFRPAAPTHTRLIAVLFTDFLASHDPLGIVPGNWNSLLWATCDGAVAWRNTNTQIHGVDTLVYYNQDATAEDFTFTLDGHNLPIGSRIALFSGDEAVPFSTGDVLVQKPDQSLQCDVRVPAYHKGKLQVKLMGPGGGKLPPDAAVEIKMTWNLPRNHKHYADAMEFLGYSLRFRQWPKTQLELGRYRIIGSAATRA